MTCDERAKIKTELETYKDRLGERIRKHNQRKGNLINSNIDWKLRCDNKIAELTDSGMAIEEITKYMDATWWPTVRKYGDIKGIDWSRF